MPTLTMPSTSTQFIQQQVIAILAGAAYDPSSDVVKMAFIAAPAFGNPPNPGVSDWHAATWVTDSNPVTYWASCLVGPSNGGVVLAAGAYCVAVQVTDNPAVPVLWGAQLLLT